MGDLVEKKGCGKFHRLSYGMPAEENSLFRYGVRTKTSYHICREKGNAYGSCLEHVRLTPFASILHFPQVHLHMHSCLNGNIKLGFTRNSPCKPSLIHFTYWRKSTELINFTLCYVNRV